MKYYAAALPLLYALITLAGCAAFKPDQYVGDGVWMRGDGTTYEAPVPLQVTDARIVNSRTETRARTEKTESTNDEGQKVIREKDILEMDTGLDIEIELEDGSIYNVYLSGVGRVNQEVSADAGFTARNGYAYSVNGNIYLHVDRPHVYLSITSKGPVRYQNTLVTD